MADVMRDFMANAVFFQDAVARTGGLNSTDLQAVSLLMSQGPATPGELAERTGLSAGGAITAVIDRLEKAGYVSRQRDQADRRRVIVTADVDKVLQQVGPIYGRVGARWAEYLEEFERNATRLGAVVHWAKDAAEHNEIVLKLLQDRGVKRVVKSKSMLTEECHLNPYLELHGIEVVDTDLGERIVQFRGEHPSHIVLPAIHIKKEEVGDCFHEHLGTAAGETGAEPGTVSERGFGALAASIGVLTRSGLSTRSRAC
jgi:DNA-binding MarR family transcriptional regulator